MSDDEDDAPIIMPNGVDFDDDDLNDDDQVDLVVAGR